MNSPRATTFHCIDAHTCGNPVRRAVVELDAPEQRLAGRSGPLRILLTGGSQGALALNRLLPETLGLLAEEHAFVVRHQAGRSIGAPG